MNIVLGSGPASVFSALALLRNGQKVLMIDPGESLEPDREKIINDAFGKPKSKWSQELFDTVKQNTHADVKGVPKKLVYGSDFPFRWLEKNVVVHQNGSDTLMSHAAGGLSNAWGANILPLLPLDTADWPISIESLLPYYKKVTEVIPVSCSDDNLSNLFFDCYSKKNPLPKSKQAINFLKDLNAHQVKLNNNGVFFGSSRLAVESRNCQECGLCLYGCPNKLIYSSSQSLDLLKSFELFEYKKGWIAKKVSESSASGRPSVFVQKLGSFEEEEISANKIFIGCGAVNSTALMIRSLNLYGTEIKLKDSQYFLTPYIRPFDNSGDVTSEGLHTLSQVAIEILNEKVCPKSIHMLFYTYNDMYFRALESLFGKLFPVVKPFMSQVLRRLIIMQGYLHSDFSGQVGVRLQKTVGSDELYLTGYQNPLTQLFVNKIHNYLIRNSVTFKGFPVTFMSHVGEPGKSYHLGGSFPMNLSSTDLSSDLLGRVQNFKNIHLVDSTVFPNIPAQNSTLTAMANAYRISEESL